MVYRFRFGPSGGSHRIISIQWYSFSFLMCRIFPADRFSCYDGEIFYGVIQQVEVLGHRFFCMSMIDVQSNAFLCFSNLLDEAFLTFSAVNHICGPGICGSFYTTPLASGHAVERSTSFYVGTRLTAWLLAWTIPLVYFFCTTISHSH